MKKKLLALILSVALMATALPFQALVGAEGEGASAATEQTSAAYNYTTDKVGVSFYHFTTWANNYGDDDGNSLNTGDATNAERLTEIEAVLKEGYVNTITVGMDSIFQDVVALCRTYGCKFWISPGRFYSADETIFTYMTRVNGYVNTIKAANAWDIFLGFHWDEPFLNGMTNDEFFTMTEALYKAYQKRIYPVFGANVLNEKLTSDTFTGEVPQTYALKYVTDAGWDSYSYDVRDSALTSVYQNAQLRKISEATGETLSTADDYYRYVHAEMMGLFDHPVNVWFYPCAYVQTSWTYNKSDEDYCRAHIEYFKDLLQEQTYKGGLSIYTYKTFHPERNESALEKHLPITDADGNWLMYPEVTKWTSLSADVKAIKTSYDSSNTAPNTNTIYTGLTNPYASDFNDSASHFMNIWDTEGTAKNGTNTGGQTKFVQTNGGLPVVNDGDETFMVLDVAESYEATTASLMVDFNSFDRSKNDAGLPTGINQTNLTHFAMRVKVSAGTEGQTSYFRLLMDPNNSDSGTYFEKDLSGAYLIDNATGEITDPDWTTGFTFNENAFDGWIVVPFSAWTSSNLHADGKFTETMNTIRYWMYYSSVTNNWVGRTLSVGDIYVLESTAQFNAIHGSAPAISATAGMNSITLAVQEGALYSMDGVNWSNTGVFTDLEYDRAYTIYSKWENGVNIASKTVWTAPYSTHLGDSASYYMSVPDENTYMLYGKQMGWGSAVLSKTADRSAYTDGGRIFVDKLGDEGFICYDFDDTQLDAKTDANNIVYINGFRDNTNSIVDISENVPTTDLTHMAVRVKIEGGTAGQASSFGMLISPLSFEKDLSNAYLIDYETRQVIDPNWTGEGFTFTDEFDGWIVFPFEAFGSGKTIGEETLTAKQILLGLAETPTSSNTASTIQFWLHDGCTNHGVTQDNSSWANRVLYVGDILVLEDDELFASVRTGCDQLGHELTFVEATEATETENGNVAHYACSHCHKTYEDAEATVEIEDVVIYAPSANEESLETES